MVDAFNEQVAAFDHYCTKLGITDRRRAVDGFIDTNPARISWTRSLKDRIARGGMLDADPESVVLGATDPSASSGSTWTGG